MLLTASPAPHWKMRRGKDHVSAKKKECRRRFPEATSPVSETKRGQARETFRQRSVQKASRKVQVITFDMANVMTMCWNVAGLMGDHSQGVRNHTRHLVSAGSARAMVSDV